MNITQRLLVNEKQMAAMLGVSWGHMINLRRRRMVPFIQLGKSIRYNPKLVEIALQKHTVREEV